MDTITLKYDRNMGTGTDGNGMHVFSGMTGLVSVDNDTTPLPLEKLLQLKEAGYTTDEIVRLRQEGLV